MEAQIEGTRATLVDLSRLGAQAILSKALRPLLRVNVAVAWAKCELPRGEETGVYRVGVEFMNADPEAVDASRKRHQQG